MTNRPTLLADVAELGNVLRAMDEWEAAGGDLDSAHGRQRFVDDLDDEATDELGGLALTSLLHAVLEESALGEVDEVVLEEPFAADESRTLREEPYRVSPQRGSQLSQRYRRVAA